MDDKAVLFFCIVMSLICLYRILLSILLLVKKLYMIDEKFYISLFYCSLVSVLVLFTNWIIVGCVLIAILPIILMLYVSLAPSRMYWIVNGYEITESTFVNELIKYNSSYSNGAYRVNKVKISRKTKENITKLEFLDLKYEEKETILKIIKNILVEKTGKSNKREIASIIGYSTLLIVFGIVALIVLFT